MLRLLLALVIPAFLGGLWLGGFFAPVPVALDSPAVLRAEAHARYLEVLAASRRTPAPEFSGYEHRRAMERGGYYATGAFVER
ncbi:MAG TPA: hypothetical protein VKA83_09115 [Methylomirabilota bacterium]|nr:hypothetical protein [Methylomirabilota bacterium]